MENLKKRWRTLRDAFIKHYRASKYKKSGDPGGKKKKWIYYDQMLFLIPFIEFKESIGSYSQAQLESENFTEADTQEDSSAHGMEESYNENTYDENVDNIPDEEVIRQDVANTPKSSLFTSKKQTHTEQNYSGKSTYTQNSKKNKSQNIDDKLMNIITKPDDADEQFMLSCVPILKRLTPRKAMIARIQIQQLLFNLEFETTSDNSRPPTRASASTTASSVYNYNYSSDNSYDLPCSRNPDNDNEAVDYFNLN